MPQASDELRAKIAAYFPDNGDEHYCALDPSNAASFLESMGWTVSDKWVITNPPKPRAEITDKEWDCVDFLAEEWDYDYSLRFEEASGPVPAK